MTSFRTLEKLVHAAAINFSLKHKFHYNSVKEEGQARIFSFILL